MLERRPKFAWTRVSKATSYVVTIYDRAEEPLWTAITSETSFSYADNRPPLVLGDYKGKVVARIGDKMTGNPALYDATTFILVNEESTARINADLARAQALDEQAASSLYISALIEHRRFPQAAGELKRALEGAPQDLALWEMLIEVCWQMKLWEAREYARNSARIPRCRQRWFARSGRAGEVL